LLRHVGNSQPRNAFGRPVDGFLAVVHDRSRARAHDAHDRPHSRRLADAIAAEQSHDLALADVEIHPVENVAFAVPGIQIAHTEEWLMELRHGPLPIRYRRCQIPYTLRSHPDCATPPRKGPQPGFLHAPEP